VKIAVFGSEGQLGVDVVAALSAHDVSPIPHEACDIRNEEGVARAVAGADWVANCAAMTNVELCETETDRAFAVNAVGARGVARACAAAGARLIHVSTDYVFDGALGRPYVEDDAPNPLNVYGVSKLAGEFFARNECVGHYIVRTSGLYGLSPCRGKGTNFVETMLRLSGERDRLRVVDDERLTPTYTADLAAQIAALIDAAPSPGLYHATNGGGCSWLEFAREVFRLEGVEVEVEGISAREWGSPVRRPADAVLENAALQAAGLDVMPRWQDALGRFLASRRESAE
jgi:dTDP-4-dehydrorhamnose reductase